MDNLKHLQSQITSLLTNLQEAFFVTKPDNIQTTDDIDKFVASLFINFKDQIYTISQTFISLPVNDQQTIKHFTSTRFKNSFLLADANEETSFLLRFCDLDFMLKDDKDHIIKVIEDRNSLLNDGLFQQVQQYILPHKIDDITLTNLFEKLLDVQKKELFQNLTLFQDICNSNSEINNHVLEKCKNLEGDELFHAYFLTMNEYMFPKKIFPENGKLVFKGAPSSTPDAQFFIVENGIIRSIIGNTTKTGTSSWEKNQGLTHPISSTLFSHFISQKLNNEKIPITQEAVLYYLKSDDALKNAPKIYKDELLNDFFASKSINALYFKLIKKHPDSPISFINTHQTITVISHEHILFNITSGNKSISKKYDAIAHELLNLGVDIKSISTFIYLIGFLSNNTTDPMSSVFIQEKINLILSVLKISSISSFNYYKNRKSEIEKHTGRIPTIHPLSHTSSYVFNEQEYPNVFIQLELLSSYLLKNKKLMALEIFFPNKTLISNFRNIVNFLYFQKPTHPIFLNLYNFSDYRFSSELIEKNQKDIISKEKDIISKEKDIISKEKDIISKEKDIISKEKDIISKAFENSELIKAETNFDAFKDFPDFFWKSASKGGVSFEGIFNFLNIPPKKSISGEQFLQSCVSHVFFITKNSDFAIEIVNQWKKEPNFLFKLFNFITINSHKFNEKKLKTITKHLLSEQAHEIKKNSIEKIIGRKL